MNALKDAVEVEAQDARMSPDTPTSAIPYPRWRIFGLVVVHIVVGWMGAYMAYSAGRNNPTVWVGAFGGLMFSQVSLLGVWGSLGTSPWWKRVIGVVVGIGYLVPVLGIGSHELITDTFIFVVVVTSFVAIPLLIVRFFRVAIRPVALPVVSASRIQFSIRHLTIFSFVIACLFAIENLVQPLVFHSRFLDFFYMALAISVVGVLPVWFVLVTKLRILYSIGFLTLGACAGHRFGLWFGSVAVWMSAMTTEAVAVVVSLLVVRSCGYRLVRLPRHRPKEVCHDEDMALHTSNPVSQSSSLSQ